MRRLITALIATSLLAGAAQAADTDAMDDLRLQLGYMLRGNMKVDQVRDQLREQFRRADLDGRPGVSQADYDLAGRLAIAEQRGHALGRHLTRDLDGDGRITREEVALSFWRQAQQRLRSGGVAIDPTPEQAREVLERLVAKEMEADANGDGVMTVDELRAFVQRQMGEQHRRHASYSRQQIPLGLDVDGDGVVSLAEYMKAADDVIAEVDRDGNGEISSEEAAANQTRLTMLRQSQQLREQRKREADAAADLARRCGLSPVRNDAFVSVVGTYKGAALADVAIGGEDAVVHVAQLDIQPGDQPLYVVLASQSGMIWQVSGAVERIRHLVVGAQEGGDNPRVGVVGVPKERVSFMAKGDCAGRIGHPRGQSVHERELALLKGLLGGRVPDQFIGRYGLARARLPLGTTFEKGPYDNAAPFPSSEQARSVYEELYRFAPGGVVRIDPKSVVSSLPVARLSVLPQAAGLAQLVDKGLLEVAEWSSAIEIGGSRVVGVENIRGARGKAVRVPSVFRVLGPMRYPAGLTGAHGVRFVVARGIKAPSGSPGHSRVTCEATGKPIAPGELCGE